MNWISRLFGKPKTTQEPDEPSAVSFAGSPQELAQAPADADLRAAPPTETDVAPRPPASLTPDPTPAPEPAAASETESIDAEDEPEEAEEDGDEADPTLGRYEPLDETALDEAALRGLRADAERVALSGPHKVGPADPAGPGSLLEALMRLEDEGRVISRVCDDADAGFYILYEPTSAD